MLRFLEVSGNDYQIGYQIGRSFKDYLQGRIGFFDDQASSMQSALDAVERKLEKDFPALLQEIYGRADGAEISRRSYLLMLFPEAYKRYDGCTTLIVKKPGSVLFAHNDDNENFTLDNTALIKYDYGDTFIVSYVMVERLAGSAFSVNGKDMVFSSNYIFGENLNLQNLSRYVVVRDVINSSSIEEVLQKLRDNDVASPFSLNVLETKTGRAVNIEKDVHDIYVTEVSERYARSNHFHTKQNDISKATADTLFRYVKANELINKLDVASCGKQDLVNILRYSTADYDKSIYKQYGDYNGKWVTDATFCIDTADDYFTVYDYIGNSVLTIGRDGKLIEQKSMN